MELRSKALHVADFHEAVELYFERGWTDGLAVVPPTPELVEKMVRASGRDPQEVLGEIAPRHGTASIEKLAINSVMAGCKPEYFPVVLAAVEAMLAPEHNLNGVQTTTHCSVPLIIVSGPIVRELEINSKAGVFGSGYRPNGTIGRAIRLILWNLGGNLPWEVDKSTFAHPGKWSYCIAEDPDENPWEPLHVERGLPAEASAVTVFTCEAPHSMLTGGDARAILHVVCNHMATLGPNNIYRMGQTLVVFNPVQAGQLALEGWAKADVKWHIWQKARVPHYQVKQADFYRSRTPEHWPKWVDRSRDDEMVPLVSQPEDILVTVAGGTGLFVMCCPGWGDLGGLAVTREIRPPQAT